MRERERVCPCNSAQSLLSLCYFCYFFLYVYVKLQYMKNCPEFISCKATFINDDVVQLPKYREFLARPVKARGDWFITFYFGWHHQVELVKLIDMKDLKDFKGD